MNKFPASDPVIFNRDTLEKPNKKPETISELNLAYEKGQGKVIIDPNEAHIEYGEALASQLKLDETGTMILWPQPDDNPDDPQNWPSQKKLQILIVLTLASFIPDFCGTISIPSTFQLANEFNTTPGRINNLTTNWAVFMLGPGGLVATILVKRYGRLPILFWSQLIGLGFLIGCATSRDLNTFAAMRCINAFFSSAPQVMGLYVINDMYPFHLQARKVNIWTSGFLCSPFVAPWLFGYLNAKISYRWGYWIALVILIGFFVEETSYARNSPLKVERAAIWPMIKLLGRPHLVAILLYMGVLFGFSIGVNITNVIFARSPPPLGYGLSAMAASSLYVTPGHHLNDWIAFTLTKRNKGIFEPEMRLWTLHLGLPFYVIGFVMLGAAFQYKLHLAILIFGWGMAQASIMLSTVACLNYANNAFNYPGEISALLNLARILGGFAVPYFQVEWASSRGALETFGCEAAIVSGLFFLTIPILQIKGKNLRVTYAMH
ncbi:major facilitator superfamily domain-containing protein [Melampsora americana]|nr:major facilitator superfamily domain-containing protein [Melampsora americana]